MSYLKDKNGSSYRDWQKRISLAHTQYRFMMARREVAVRVFGESRANELEKMARSMLFEPSQLRPMKISMLNAFELALQIEAENRGKFEEIIRRAWLLVDDTEGHVGGILQSITQVLLTERAQRGDLSGDS